MWLQFDDQSGVMGISVVLMVARRRRLILGAAACICEGKKNALGDSGDPCRVLLECAVAVLGKPNDVAL